MDGSDRVINVAYRSDAVADRSDDVADRSDAVAGHTASMTEPEWSGEVEYRHALERLLHWALAMGTQYQSPHYIVYGHSKNLVNRQRT